MKKYDAYKPSGIEWIGEVPEEWSICRLKNQADVVLGKMIMSNPPKDTNTKYTLEKYLKSKNIGWLELFDTEDEVEEMWFNDNEKKLYRLKEGDIVMNEGGDIGKVAVWVSASYECYIQNSVNKITPYKTTNTKYLSFLLFAISKTNYFWSIVSQVSIAHLTKEKLMNTPICVPPLPEQVSIADYLDAKCAKIDNVVTIQQKRIVLLKELKQSIITRAVTKGLDKNTKMKDSGIEWIGQMPAKWGTIHIKRTCVCKNGLFIDGDWIESKDLAGDSGTIRYLTSGNVGVIKYKEQGDGFITEEKFNELQCTEVLTGDILISRLNEPIGRACIVPDLNSKVVCAVDNVICRPDDSLYDRRYLVYQMNCRAYSDYTNCLARGTGMHRISRAMLGQISILVPSLSEQTAIADYLDKKCAIIDRQIAKVEKQIELLNEYKQSVITECVTGKRKVC